MKTTKLIFFRNIHLHIVKIYRLIFVGFCAVFIDFLLVMEKRIKGIENKIRWGLLRVFGQSRFYRLAG